MIIANKANRAKHAVLQSHFEMERSARMAFNANQERLIGYDLDPLVQAVNRAGIFTPDFWLEVDRTTQSVAEDTRGREIFDDLQALVSPLPIGKTVKAYTNAGDIMDDVQISMDGQAPFSFDHTGYAGDGDPIPMFTSGYGANWRFTLGAQSGGWDVLLDSQRAKLKKQYAKMNSYMLNGDARISEAGFKGQGIKNHRNTAKIELGATGANIDLTTATADQLVEFWSKVFSATLDDNNVAQVDVVWVSKEIRANMAQPFSKSDGFKEGTIEENVLRYSPRIKEFRTAYSLNLNGVGGLSGNEFIAYVRSKTFIDIPTGQSVQIVPLPRLMPRANFNFDISAAFGVSVKKDAGNSGVFYGGELT